MKRGQTATEYVIVLAFLGLILILITSAIFDLPSLFQNNEEIRSREYWSTTPIGILGMDSTAINTTIVVKNNFRQSITVSNISIDGIFYSFTNLTSEPIVSGGTGAYYSTSIFSEKWIDVAFNVSFESSNKYWFNGTQKYPLD